MIADLSASREALKSAALPTNLERIVSKRKNYVCFLVSSVAMVIEKIVVA